MTVWPDERTLYLIAFWLLLAVALVSFFWDYVPKIPKLRRWKLILLSEATLAAYEQLRKQDGGKIIEVLNQENFDMRFTHLAEKMLEQPGAVLYGKHPPSTVVEVIPIKEMGEMADDCSHTTYKNGNTLYSDLMIERSLLKRYLRHLKD